MKNISKNGWLNAVSEKQTKKERKMVMKNPNVYKKINSILKKLETGMYKTDESGHLEPCNYGEGIVYDKNDVLTDSSVAMLKNFFLSMDSSGSWKQKHADQHISTDEVKILEPVAAKQKYINSAFTDEKVQWSQMFKNLIKNRYQIKKFATGHYGKNGVFTAEINDDAAKGKTFGFIDIGNFTHRFTSDKYVTVVIKKSDASDICIQTGFSGISYNPHLLSDNERENPDAPLLRESYDYIQTRSALNIENTAKLLDVSNKDCSSIMKQTQAYKNGNNIERIYLMFQSNPRNKYTNPKDIPDNYNPMVNPPDVSLSSLSENSRGKQHFGVYIKQEDNSIIAIDVKENILSINHLDKNKKQISLLPEKMFEQISIHDVTHNTDAYQKIKSKYSNIRSTINELTRIIISETKQKSSLQKQRNGIDLQTDMQTDINLPERN